MVVEATEICIWYFNYTRKCSRPLCHLVISSLLQRQNLYMVGTQHSPADGSKPALKEPPQSSLEPEPLAALSLKFRIVPCEDFKTRTSTFEFCFFVQFMLACTTHGRENDVVTRPSEQLPFGDLTHRYLLCIRPAAAYHGDCARGPNCPCRHVLVK